MRFKTLMADEFALKRFRHIPVAFLVHLREFVHSDGFDSAFRTLVLFLVVSMGGEINFFVFGVGVLRVRRRGAAVNRLVVFDFRRRRLLVVGQDVAREELRIGGKNFSAVNYGDDVCVDVGGVRFKTSMNVYFVL